MHIVFRCDAGRRLGAGHLMRCLTLADALAEAGSACVFLCREIPEHLAARVESHGHRLIRFTAGRGLIERGDGDSREEEDAAACLAALGGQKFDWLVADHYDLGATWESGMRRVAKCILALDDLARFHDCDIVFDQTLGRDPSAYEPFVPRGCTILCGARDALLRPEFAAARPASVHRRRDPHVLRRVFVNFGGGELSGLLLAALYSLDGLPGIEVRAVRGGSRHLPQDLRVSYPLQLFDFVDDIASHLAWADFAIGAPGSSSWERACLGVPSIVVPFAGNQDLVAANLAQAGWAWSMGRDELMKKVPGLLRPLLQENHQLPRMSIAASAAVDGWGAARLAARLLGRPLWLRPVLPDDCELLWHWANDPLVRQMSFRPEAIPWESHRSWFVDQLARQGQSSFIAIGCDFQDAPLGQVRFDLGDDGVWTTDIHLAPEARGHGLGQHLLTAATNHLRRDIGPCRVRSAVLHGNASSLRLFLACGFVPGRNTAECRHFDLDLTGEPT